MNNIFSAHRFWFLLKKTVLERPAQIFGFTGMLFTLVLMIYLVGRSIGFIAAQSLTFIWGLPCGSFLLASFVFGYFNSSSLGSSFLTLPASNFEKWLSGILIAGIIYPLLFLLFYHVMDVSYVAFYHNRLDLSDPFYKEKYASVYPFELNGAIAWKVYNVFFLLTGAMLVGALYFNKAAFIKVAIITCIFVLGFFGLNWLLSLMFFGNISKAQPFSHITIRVGKEEGTIELPEKISNIFYYSVWYILPAILWLLSYIRLREKEF